MNIYLKVLWTKPGIIIAMSLIILIQRWYYRSNPEIRERVKTVTETLIKEIPIVKEIQKPGRVTEKLIYVKVPVEIIEVAKIDTQIIKIKDIPTIRVIEAIFKDDRTNIKLLIGDTLMVFSIPLAAEGKTRITPWTSFEPLTNVKVKQQRYGFFTAINVGYSTSERFVTAVDFLYLNRFLIFKDLRVGMQINFRTNQQGDFGIHIGWQPFPSLNNVIITPELYLYPKKYASIGLYVRLFKF